MKENRKSLSYFFGKTPKTPSGSPTISPISKSNPSLPPSPQSPPKSSKWETINWKTRLDECVFKQKGEKHIHLDLSAKNNQLAKISDDDMGRVIEKIQKIINSNEGCTFKLDLSGNKIDIKWLVALNGLLAGNRGEITKLDIGQPAATFSYGARAFLNRLLRTDLLCIDRELTFTKLKGSTGDIEKPEKPEETLLGDDGFKEINTGLNAGLKEINFAGVHPDIGTYLNLTNLYKNTTLQKMNGYDVATTDFSQINLNKHKDGWKDVFSECEKRRTEDTVLFDFSGEFTTQYHDMSEVTAKLKEWQDTNPNIKLKLNFSNNPLTYNGIFALSQFIKAAPENSIIGLDISNNPLNKASCILLYNILRNNTSLESINFANSGYEKNQEDLQTAIQKNKILKFVNGYPVLTTDFTQIDLNRHKNAWQDVFSACAKRRIENTVSFDFSGEFTTQYHDMSEVTAKLKEWQDNNPKVKLKLNFSSNALNKKDILELSQFIGAVPENSIIGFDISNNHLNVASYNFEFYKLLYQLLHHNTSLESVNFANSGYEKIQEDLQRAIQIVIKIHKTLKFVNGYEIGCEEIDYSTFKEEKDEPKESFTLLESINFTNSGYEKIQEDLQSPIQDVEKNSYFKLK